MSNLQDLWDDSAADNVEFELPKTPGITFCLVSLRALGNRRPKAKTPIVESNLNSLFTAGLRLALELNGPVILQLATGRPGPRAQRALIPPKRSSLKVAKPRQRTDKTNLDNSNILKFPKMPQRRFTQVANGSPPTEEILRSVARLTDRLDAMDERMKAFSGMVESMRRTWRESNGFTPVNAELPPT